jgi:RNA methyltransferase, TrmH family
MFSKSTIKYIQSLQHKKFRDEYHAFVAEGPKVVSELLQSDIFACKAVYAVQDWVSGIDKNIGKRISAVVEVIKDFELEKIAAYSTANKVVAVFEKRLPDVNISIKNKLTLVLDDIRDPGNLGTIIRTADWFGVENIICSNNSVDMYNPKVVQSTMASIGNVNIIYTNLESWLEEQKGIQKFAATLNGINIHEVKGIREAIIIIGNESNGISSAVMEMAGEKITIPKIGWAESLNAAVATGIILYAFNG